MKWLTILFTLFIILIIVLADMGKLNTSYLVRIPYADKAGHFILYGSLILLIDLTLFRSLPPSLSLSTSRKWIAIISGLSLALLIGLEECSQQFFAKRSFDLVDLTFSYLGVIFFSWLAVQITRRK